LAVRRGALRAGLGADAALEPRPGKQADGSVTCTGRPR
jgi:hypothetical protein